MNEKWILKVLVGSRAHGLSTPTSDYDYRGVFVQPTSAILSLRGVTKQTSWIEGRDVNEAGKKEDDTAWELGHFLKLATHCNPTILETFTAPIEETTPEGDKLRGLFPAVWNPQGVRDAFVGYGLNQRKKFLDNKDVRPYKYATAYLRALVQAEWLLRTGILLCDMTRHDEFQTLLMFKNGMATPGDVINKCLVWERKVDAAFKECHHKPDPDAVDAFLLSVRQENW